MKIVIRTDSSEEIGSGHLVRCLTLATCMRNGGATVSFICRELKGNLSELVRTNGFDVKTLPSIPSGNKSDGEQFAQLDLKQCGQFLNADDPVDWIIVDHYRLDQTWEKRAREFANNILVIDDLADRRHDCDLLLDQNLFDKLETRYDDLTPPECVKLLGPGYAMLRDQFPKMRRSLRIRSGRMERIFIFLGAADSNRITEKIIDGVEELNRPDLKIDLVVGGCNLNAANIKKRCTSISGITFYQQVDNIATLMASADIAIGAGGSTTWERCCLGLPTLFIATTANEIELAQTCGQIEIGKYLGSYSEIDGQLIRQELHDLLEKPELLRRWGDNASKLVDGHGVEKVCQKIYSLTKEPAS